MFVRLRTCIRTPRGTIKRTGPARNAGGDVISLPGGLIAYPDRRTEWIEIHTSDAIDGSYYIHSKWTCTPSTTGNHAYATLDPSADYYVPVDRIDLTTNEDGGAWNTGTLLDEDQVTAENMRLDYDPNRILVSEASLIRSYKARRVFQIGQGADDQVLAFAANTQALSEGQFGRNPVFAFTGQSITPLYVADDLTAVTGGASGEPVSFLKGEPIEVTMGLIGRKAITNIKGLIAFASADGIYLLGSQGLERISDKLHTHFAALDPDRPSWAAQDILDAMAASGTAGEDVRLQFVIDRDLGLNECWVYTDDRTYVMDLASNEWTTATRVRVGSLLYRSPGATAYRLYGINTDGELVEESALVDAAGDAAAPAPQQTTGTVETVKLHLGWPGFKKRLRRIAFRSRKMMDQVDWSLLVPLNRDPVGLGGLAACDFDEDLHAGCNTPPGDLTRIVARSGSFIAKQTLDVQRIGFCKVEDFVLRLVITAKPGQSIETAEFIVQPVEVERRRIQNFETTVPT